MLTPLRASLPLLLALSPALAAAAPVVVGLPSAPFSAEPGDGLCVITAPASSPVTQFPQASGAFVAGMNGFFDADRSAWTVRAASPLLDLSNNLNDGRTLSYGDFVNAVAGCDNGGCSFGVDPAGGAFGTRMRGYYRVGAALANQPIHLGLYADDAASVTFFDAAGAAYPVHVQPPQLGSPTWRASGSVTFPAAGWYPVEILHAQIVEHAALELSTFVGTFTDFARPANQPPVVDLAASGFTLIASTDLARSVTGTVDAVCMQCDRSADATGCPAGSICNAAGICEVPHPIPDAGADDAGVVDAGANDASVPTDASTSAPDAAAPSTPVPVVDASPEPSSKNPPPAGEEGGCGCDATSSSSHTAMGVLTVLAALLVRRKR